MTAAEWVCSNLHQCDNADAFYPSSTPQVATTLTFYERMARQLDRRTQHERLGVLMMTIPCNLDRL